MPPQNPTTSDPYAQDQITQVPADRREGMLGLLGGHGKSASIDDMIKQHHDARLTNAQMYANASKTAVGNYLHAQQGIDPRTNQRFDDPDYKGINPITGQPFANAQEAKDALQQYYNNQHEEAWGNYTKIAGVNPEAKGALGKAQAILQHIMGQGAVQGVPQQQPQRGGQMAAPPAPSTPNYPTTVSEAGVTQTVAPQARGMAPPPQAPSGPSFLAQAPFLRAQEEFTRGLGQRSTEMASDVNTRDALVKKVIPKEDWNKPYVQDYKLTGNMSRGMIAHMQKTNMIDPETGLPVFADPNSGTYSDTQGNIVDKPVPFQKPVLIGYKGPNGEPLFGTEAYGKLYDQAGTQLPEGTQKFYPALADKHTVNYGYRQVTQPDGRIVQVPTVTVTDTSRGGQISAPSKPTASNTAATPQGANQTPNPPVTKAGIGGAPRSSVIPKPSSASDATLMGLPKGSRVVGGKVPPGVAKSYETFNGSQERYTVMEQALPRALKGDQQAMINLLYNHIGMTTGLQKGARITKDLISEAENSSPLAARLLKRIGIDNEFEITPTVLSGVVLDSATMHNMIALAKERRDQDQMAWQREIAAAKGGYGMSAGATVPQGSTAPESAPTATSSGNTLGYTDGGRNFNIPKEMVKDFLKDHPNAKPR